MENKKEQRKAVGIKMDVKLFEELSKYCKKEGYTKSGFIEKIVREKLMKAGVIK